MEFSTKQIAIFIQGEIVGDESATVHTFAKIREGIPGTISFLSNPKYIPYLYETQSSIILVNKNFVPKQKVKATMIKVDNAYESLAKLLSLYEQGKPKRIGIDSRTYVTETTKIDKDVYIAPSACIGEYAEVGDNTVIHPHATIGSGAKVSNDCIIYADVTIYHDRHIGSRCILHAGCVIGADGFGFAPTPESYEETPQIGVTILEDDIEVGTNTCVNHAAMGATIIHSGVKLNSLIRVTYNDEIGSHTVMVAQVDIAGSTKVGGWCVFGDQVGIARHIHIGSKVNLGTQSGVPSSIKEGNQLIGAPPVEMKSYFKSQSVLRKLPDMYFEMNTFRKEFNELKRQLGK